MARQFCGTEVLKAKDIAFIRNTTVRKGREWLKAAKLKCGLSEDEDFTVLHFSIVNGTSLEETIKMLNIKYAAKGE